LCFSYLLRLLPLVTMELARSMTTMVLKSNKKGSKGGGMSKLWVLLISCKTLLTNAMLSSSLSTQTKTKKWLGAAIPQRKFNSKTLYSCQTTQHWLTQPLVHLANLDSWTLNSRTSPSLFYPLNSSPSMMITRFLFLLGATVGISLDLVMSLSSRGKNYQLLMRSRKHLMKLRSWILISRISAPRTLEVVSGLNENI